MTEKILFGIIGALMLAVTGVGVTAAVKHPDEAASILPSAVSTVERAARDVADASVQAVTTLRGGSSGEQNESAAGTGSPVVRNESDEGEDDEGDDDRGSRTASPSQGTPPAVTAPKPPVSTPTSGAHAYTMQEVAAHSSVASCYSAINGSVYDLTSFINQHPGGSAAIKSLCGVDGTAAFNGQHGGQRRPASELASLKIGTLAQ